MKLHHVSCKLCLILCGVAALLCATPIRAGSPSAPITAILLPDGAYSPVAIREMGREAAGILKHSGLKLHWRVGVSSQATSELLVVVRLRGACEMDAPPAPLQGGALGWSNEVDGTVLPFGELACDKIRGLIGAAVPSNDVPSDVLLGRAMGRVLAHELYHMIARTDKHEAGGVTRAALSGRELISGDLELQPSDVEAIQNGLREAGR
jgi:hypothetical protein